MYNLKLVFTRPFGPAYIRLHVAKYTKECASNLRHTKTCTNESVSYLSIYCALLCVRKREKYLEGTGLRDEYRILISDTFDTPRDSSYTLTETAFRN